MATFGKNMKLTVDRAQRDRLQLVMTEALGCRSIEPKEGLTVFALADGFSIGVYWVEASQALADDDQALAAWLEICVDDVAKTHDALLAKQVAVVPYPVDPEHTYYQLPGGPVFRLARA